jgi:hypothetical protein
MDAPSFADLWQQEEFSDVEVLLIAADTTLARFPGHNVILSRSPYFAAQVGWLEGDIAPWVNLYHNAHQSTGTALARTCACCCHSHYTQNLTLFSSYQVGVNTTYLTH